MIAGVCGGLGEYFEIDPVLVRIIFVVLTLAGAAGVWIYLLLWIVIPNKGDASESMEEQVKKNAQEIGDRVTKVTKTVQQDRNARMVLGSFVVFVGVFLILANLGILSWFRFDLIWPIILVVCGIYIILKQK